MRRFAYVSALLLVSFVWSGSPATTHNDAEPSTYYASLISLSQPAFAQSPGITSPAAGSSVSGNVPILGTAVIEPFQRYEIYIKQEPNGDDAYIYVSGGTQPVTNGQLGTINIDTFAPGQYSIRLRVVKLDGNYAEYFAPNLSFNQAPAEPTPTATSSEPTPTPIPTATFTPAPQPTPIVGQVTQPVVQNDNVPNTPTPEPVVADDSNAAASGAEDLGSDSTDAGTAVETANLSLPGNETNTASESGSGGITSQLGEVVGLEQLRGQFMTGMRYSAIAFILIGLLFLGKGVVRWMLSQI